MMAAVVIGIGKATEPKKPSEDRFIGTIDEDALFRLEDKELGIICYTIRGGYNIHAISCVKK